MRQANAPNQMPRQHWPGAFGQVTGGGTSTLYSSAAARVAALLDSGNPDPGLLSGMLATPVAVQQFRD